MEWRTVIAGPDLQKFDEGKLSEVCDAEAYAAGGCGVVDLLFAAFVAEGVFCPGALSNVQRAEHAFFICIIAYCGYN